LCYVVYFGVGMAGRLGLPFHNICNVSCDGSEISSEITASERQILGVGVSGSQPAASPAIL